MADDSGTLVTYDMIPSNKRILNGKEMNGNGWDEVDDLEANSLFALGPSVWTTHQPEVHSAYEPKSNLPV